MCRVVMAGAIDRRPAEKIKLHPHTLRRGHSDRRDVERASNYTLQHSNFRLRPCEEVGLGLPASNVALAGRRDVPLASKNDPAQSFVQRFAVLDDVMKDRRRKNVLDLAIAHQVRDGVLSVAPCFDLAFLRHASPRGNEIGRSDFVLSANNDGHAELVVARRKSLVGHRAIEYHDAVWRKTDAMQ